MKALHWEDPLQIFGGEIATSQIYGGIHDVQASTSQGFVDLYGFDKSQFSGADLIEFKRWNNARSPSIVIRTEAPVAAVAVGYSATIENDVTDDKERHDDWRTCPNRLLEKLQDPSINRDELFDAVLFAEVAAFDESQTESLTNRLFDFVSAYRLSQDEDTKTFVGSAIRKLAMNLRDEQIEEYADLFLPTATDTLPCEIELELAKAILWRLTGTPTSLSLDFPKLESHLAELASDYLKPRLILQENYASVALQAILGALLLDGPHAESILESVKALKIDWFTDQLQRRIERLRLKLADTGIADRLAGFELQLDVHQSQTT